MLAAARGRLLLLPPCFCELSAVPPGSSPLSAGHSFCLPLRPVCLRSAVCYLSAPGQLSATCLLPVSCLLPVCSRSAVLYCHLRSVVCYLCLLPVNCLLPVSYLLPLCTAGRLSVLSPPPLLPLSAPCQLSVATVRWPVSCLSPLSAPGRRGPRERRLTPRGPSGGGPAGHSALFGRLGSGAAADASWPAQAVMVMCGC